MNSAMKKDTLEKIILLLAVILVFFIYQNTLLWLVTSWATNPDNSHGFLIPIISAYIIWKKKENIKKLVPDSSKKGLALILLGLLLQIISVRSTINFISAYSFIILLLGLAMYWWGEEVSKEILFPIAFLFFMVPFSDFLLTPISYNLKLFSSYLSTEAVKLLSIPIYREGVLISLAAGKVEVADPCSGIRSLLGFLMMGTLFAYFADGPTFKKVILFLFIVPFVVLGNSFRILSILLIFNFKGVLISNTHWETLLGVIVVILVTSGMLLTGRLLKCQIRNL